MNKEKVIMNFNAKSTRPSEIAILEKRNDDLSIQKLETLIEKIENIKNMPNNNKVSDNISPMGL